MDHPLGTPPRAGTTGRVVLPAIATPAISRSEVLADDDIRHLAASLNHQLRTPLTVLVGHGELLASNAEGLPAAHRESLLALNTAVQDLSEAVGRVTHVLHEVQTRARH